MTDNDRFRDLFADFEYRLKRRGFLKRRPDAQANWEMFARAIGQAFFEEVRMEGIANTLIGAPPGKLLAEHMDWTRPDAPLATTEALFVQGVCRVRNSLNHGEKFRGDYLQQARDTTLVAEALAVLEASEGLLETVPSPTD